MPKRKAETPSQHNVFPNRPRTRSSGHLATTQTTQSPNKRRRKIPSTSLTSQIVDNRGPKENDTNSPGREANGSSRDELDLIGATSTKGHDSPGTPEPSTHFARNGTSPRQIMEAVVITTPRSVMKTPQSFFNLVLGSPTLYHPKRKIGNTSPLLPVGHKRLHSSPQSSPNSSGPVTSSISFPVHSLSLGIPPTHASSSRSRPEDAAEHLPLSLPLRLVPHLRSQKRAILHALQHPPLVEYESMPHSLVSSQLKELVNGTTQRHEGNSCLIIGPKGSGKTRLVDRVLASATSSSNNTPVIVRLSAHFQINDRLAMREIARQVYQQIGFSCLSNVEGDEQDLTKTDSSDIDMDLPPSSHLPGMIAGLPGLGHPVVIVLDGFDGFAAHARQALLYCLLDTVQSCRGSPTLINPENETTDPTIDTTDHQNMRSTLQGDRIVGNGGNETNTTRGEHGLLVIGVTSRVDCLTLLEKRVKSRFSHRLMRVSTPPCLNDLLKVLKVALDMEVENGRNTDEEWKRLWSINVKGFLANKDVVSVMKEVFAFGKDLRALFRLLITPVIALTPSSPWLTASQLAVSMSAQRCPKHFPFLTALAYPHVALLIAAAHIQTAGHETFNFEILHNGFLTQVRVSISTPAQGERVGLGMVNIARGVMFGAFEHLVTCHVFQPVAAPSTHTTPEFIRYRCMAMREDIKRAVEQLGQTNLKKWFSRNQ